MIKSEYFQKDTIIKMRNKHKIADPGLFEKAIHAFALLGHLADSQINFVFKGGTSLLLHIPEPQRLSIDIDILCSEDPDTLEAVLNEISHKPPFLRFEENKRGHRGLPNRRHFKFFYEPQISNQNHILLDVVEDPECHLELEEKVIDTIFFETERDVKVKIPTKEALLGDKLTAFAPNTVGVPFVTQNGNDHSLQVVKQLFDIGQLFNVASDYKIISDSYNSSFELENTYRDIKCTREEALDDTAEIALELCRIRVKKYTPSITSESLIRGISKIEGHLIRNPFRQELEAKIAASKAYMLARMIKTNSFDLLEEHGKFEQTDEQVEFAGTISIDPQLNKLKGINLEAFYYLALGNEC